MWIPKKLIIRNFGTHIETIHEFSKGKTTLIQGLNLDDPEQESNGSGKSFIKEAIEYLIIGSSSRKTTDKKLVRRGETESFLSISLSNPFTKQNLLIERSLFTKKSASCKVTLNNELQVKSSVDEYNNYILELLGITRDDILNFYIISKEKYKSFYSKSDNDKKDIIGRFSNAILISDIDTLIDSDIVKKESLIVKNNESIIKLNTSLGIYQEQLNTIDVEQIKKDQINLVMIDIENTYSQMEDMALKVNETKTFIKTDSVNIDKIKGNIIFIENKIKSFEKTSFEKEIKELDKTIDEIIINGKRERVLLDEKNKLKSDWKVQINEFETIVASSITCPKCSHEFVLDSDVSVSEAREILPEMKKELDLMAVNISNIENTISTLLQRNKLLNENKEIYIKKEKTAIVAKKLIETELNEANFSLNKVLNSIKISNDSISSYNKRYAELEQYILGREKDIEELLVKVYEDASKDISDKIKSIELQIETENSTHKTLETELSKLTEWKFNFKRFRSFLANKAIKSIEGLTNVQLSKMNSNLQVSFDGYKILGNGELREKISVDVLRNGILEGDFNEFSGGERGRIEIATICALQQLINMSSKTGGVDLAVIDEVLESVDGRGIKSISKSLNNLHKTIYIVTHVNVQSEEGCNVVLITKKDGISTLN